MRASDVGRASIAVAIAVSAASLGCQAIADPDVEYVPCFAEAPPGDYQEDFIGRSWQELQDRRCWQSDNLGGAKVLVEDEELVLRPSSRAVWSETTQAPLLFRRVKGDFAVFARVEATQGLPDKCLGLDDFAGLAVRSTDRASWATFLTQPIFGAQPCTDVVEPLVRVVQRTSGFAEQGEQRVEGVGFDGEVDIAICRVNGALSYAVGNWGNDQIPWMSLESHAVTTEPVDVGLTTTSSGEAGVEGHFPWVRFVEDLGSDACPGALERFGTVPKQP